MFIEHLEIPNAYVNWISLHKLIELICVYEQIFLHYMDMAVWQDEYVNLVRFLQIFVYDVKIRLDTLDADACVPHSKHARLLTNSVNHFKSLHSLNDTWTWTWHIVLVSP